MRRETKPGQNMEDNLHTHIAYCRYRHSLSGHDVWLERMKLAKERLRLLLLALEDRK